MAEVPPPYGYAIFCEDIRSEIGGKYSLMGIYQSVLFVNVPLPFVMPKLCIMSTYCEPIESGIRRKGVLTVRVFLPGHADAPAAEFQLPLVPTQQLPQPQYDDSDIMPLMRFDVPIIIQPFIIERPGIVKVRGFIEDEIVRMGALTIEMAAPNPSMANQPS